MSHHVTKYYIDMVSTSEFPKNCTKTCALERLKDLKRTFREGAKRISEEELIEILTEVYSVCKYCDLQNGEWTRRVSSSLGVLGDLTTSLDISTDGEEYFIGAYSYFSHIDSCVGDCIKINYCPVCGRKLTEVSA